MNNNTLGLSNIFFEALKYPEFARPNFFINKQKESGWSKGVYLTALDEVYHNTISILQMHFNKKKNSGEIEFEEFQISKKVLFGDNDDLTINKSILDELHYAIKRTWRFDKVLKTYSPYEILAFVEVAL